MTADSVISVVCGCGKKLKAPASAAGKKARCPACRTVVLLSAGQNSGAVSASKNVRPAPAGAVQAAQAPARPIPAPRAAAEDQEDDLGAMYELAQQANSAVAAPVGNLCPQCHTAMDETAVLCTSCGFDARTGKSVAAAVPAAPRRAAAKKAGKPVDYMAPDGSLTLGIILSIVFALAASLVWIAVAYLTGLTIGWIAILIGAGAGIGMQVGHRGFSRLGGVIAVCTTLLAIIVAKVAVLELVLMRANKTIADIDSAKLGYYFFSPIGLIIILVGLGCAYRTANGSSK